MKVFSFKHRAWAALALSFVLSWVLPGPARAMQAARPSASEPSANPQVQAFDLSDWNAWLAAPRRARVVLFSTTFCAHCPALAEAIAERLAAERLAAELHVVIMDREPDARHRDLYRRASALHVFDDDAARLRHAVDPGWRGGTPFVVLLPGGGRAARVSLGAPSAQAWRQWASEFSR